MAGLVGVRVLTRLQSLLGWPATREEETASSSTRSGTCIGGGYYRQG